MSVEENKATMRLLIEELFNRKRVEAADELVAEDFIHHGALPGQAPGREGAKQRWAMFNAAIPDMHCTIDDMVAEGDKVVVRYTVEGTHQGEMMGIPPTGKRFRFSGININRFADGRLAEHWEQADMLGLMQQLGVIPAPARAG